MGTNELLERLGEVLRGYITRSSFLFRDQQYLFTFYVTEIEIERLLRCG